MDCGKPRVPGRIPLREVENEEFSGKELRNYHCEGQKKGSAVVMDKRITTARGGKWGVQW